VTVPPFCSLSTLIHFLLRYLPVYPRSCVAPHHKMLSRHGTTRTSGASICFALVLSAPSRNYAAITAFASSKNLSQVYRDIATRSNLLDQWPDSRKICEDCLVHDDASNTYTLPSFPDGHGTLGVFGFLHGNSEAQGIMGPCDIIFSEFCSRVKTQVLNNDSLQCRVMDRWILHPPPSSHHISVAIIQEHHSFLKDQLDIDKWQPISDATIRHLAESFASEHTSQLQAPPELQLDSLLWTPDGALIAGFLDNTPEQAFEQIRSSSRRIARDVLGDVLTTRPKNLIHATVGRVIGLPTGATNRQYEMLTSLAQEYNEEVFPDLVATIKTKTPSFTLDELTLARNVIWMLKEYKAYQTWSLSGYK
jgi:hypothetical protein